MPTNLHFTTLKYRFGDAEGLAPCCTLQTTQIAARRSAWPEFSITTTSWICNKAFVGRDHSLESGLMAFQIRDPHARLRFRQDLASNTTRNHQIGDVPCLEQHPTSSRLGEGDFSWNSSQPAWSGHGKMYLKNVACDWRQGVVDSTPPATQGVSIHMYSLATISALRDGWTGTTTSRHLSH